MRHGFVKVRCYSPELRVGDVSFNKEQIISALTDSYDRGVKVLALPELSLTGYTCYDLFTQSALTSACEKAVLEIAEASEGMDTVLVFGAPLSVDSSLYDCAVVVSDGEILGVVPKTVLETYGQSYEGRYFTDDFDSIDEIEICGELYPFGTDIIFRCDTLKELKIAVELGNEGNYPLASSQYLASMGATLIVNPSASSEVIGAEETRVRDCSYKSASLMCAYMTVNPSELESTTDVVFSAHSAAFELGKKIGESKPFANINGDVIAEIDVDAIENARRRNTSFANGDTDARYVPFVLDIEDTEITRYVNPHPFVPACGDELNRRCEKILTMQERALARRLKASYSKCGVLGISGGLDSTLTLLAAVRAADYLGWDRSRIVAITMPCFGTTKRTKSNATELCSALGVTLKEIDILNSVRVHFKDIGHEESNRNVTYENAQARERTQILMDVANDLGGLVIGTGDLSEIALGWSTYNADHMSMYNTNCDVPKTLIRHVVAYSAAQLSGRAKEILLDILDTPVSPELLPPDEKDDIAQKTEDLVGPYDLHDFFLYNFIRKSFAPSKIYRLAKVAFDGQFSDEAIYKWLTVFIKRFFSQQFKRSCSPDGVKVGSVALSPRGDLKMPSDSVSALWLSELEEYINKDRKKKK